MSLCIKIHRKMKEVAYRAPSVSLASVISLGLLLILVSSNSWRPSHGGLLLHHPLRDCLNFSFASYYGDHMVLQKEPREANVWGFASHEMEGASVELTLSDEQGSFEESYHGTVLKSMWHGKLIWSFKLKPRAAGGPYRVSVTLNLCSITIRDILFGDVWICSGQSNMAYTVPMMLNGSEEMAAADKYPDIRLFTVDCCAASEPEQDLGTVRQSWSVSERDSVGNKVRWSYFSAVCYVYGRHLYESLKYPIGLIASSRGNTAIESWTRESVLTTCGVTIEHELARVTGVKKAASLFNGMIYPLRRMTIFGIIWYQGEKNAAPDHHTDYYNCTFPGLVQDWRETFSKGSQSTSDNFPFGFVQLAPCVDLPSSGKQWDFAVIRWHQTADMGYVPNKKLPNVFMAVAMDLPHPDPRRTSVHPSDKGTIGLRLSLAGRAVAYNQSVRYQGPLATSYDEGTDGNTLRVEFDKGKSYILVNNMDGFEVCCTSNPQDQCSFTDKRWKESPIVSHDSVSVTISLESCAKKRITGLRYAWRNYPCRYKQCAIYSKENQLPMAPFVIQKLLN